MSDTCERCRRYGRDNQIDAPSTRYCKPCYDEIKRMIRTADKVHLFKI